MNPFARRYLFVGDLEWRRSIFGQIMRIYPVDWISKISMAATHQFIELKDGSCFDFMPEGEGCRGRRAHNIYVSTDIEKRFIDQVLTPMLVSGKVYSMVDNIGDVRPI